MRKIVTLIVCLLLRATLFGQAFDTEFNPVERWDERQEIVSDEHIFHSPVWEAPDPFRNLSRYRFGGVSYRERGLDDRFRRLSVGGIDLSDNISPYPDYTLITLLWKSSYRRGITPAMVAANSHASTVGYSEHYSPKASIIPKQSHISIRAADRGYRAGLDIDHKTEWGRGWSGYLGGSGRWGADGHISGVRSNNAGVFGSITKDLRGERSLTFFVATNHSVRGVRSGAVQEAFDLTGDRVYNPNWGWQNGRVRNARERRDNRYMALVEFETPLGDNRRLTASVGFRWGRGGYSSLAWYNTHSPMPDYYRKMPSSFPDWNAADDIKQAWRENDPSVTQIDWTELYYANTMEGAHSLYILEERVERTRNISANVRIDRRLTGELNVTYGFALTAEGVRYFKEARDMLGGEYVYNIDQYVSDYDGEYRVGAGNDNDLRNPGRRVRRGDRFGYDYAINRFAPSLFGILRWNRARYGITASASLSNTALRRRGFYEKELFPGEESYGRSAAAKFTTYSLGISSYWNVSVKHKLSLSALVSSEAPFAQNIFISPEQNNHLIASPAVAAIYGAEGSWSFGVKNLDIRVTGFLNAVTGETQIRQYYDDLAVTFSNIVVRGVDKLCYGIEASIEAGLTRWLSITAGGSVGNFRYNSEPTADIYADIDNSPVSQGVVCYMSGLKLGSPQIVGAVELTYSDRKRWRVALTAEYMGDRYVAVNPLYHSSRIRGINTAPEIMRLFTSQERLADVFTLGLSVSKGFVLKKGYLRVAAWARNILGTDMIYSGYEQMRILRSASGINSTMVPFPSKYLWSYPLTWNITVSYRL